MYVCKNLLNYNIFWKFLKVFKRGIKRNENNVDQFSCHFGSFGTTFFFFEGGKFDFFHMWASFSC